LTDFISVSWNSFNIFILYLPHCRKFYPVKSDTMKTLPIILLAALISFLPALTQAQATDARLVEKHPEPSTVVKRFSETDYARQMHSRATSPVILAMVNAISTDTLRATLLEMQQWGSRLLMNDNKKEIAMSLVNKFLSYGYTDVKLDSFYLVIPNWGGYSDSSWQYNIVCTLRGASAPNEIYTVGGHWDSYCTPDPFHNAPGVNDNGTAVAATLEIARVMKKLNYTPEATIKFTLYAAEELGLFGSRYAAAKARTSGTDLRYMLNLDMISNNPQNLDEVKVYQYYGFEWAGFVAAESTARYTDLTVVFPQNYANSGSDSFPYWLEGFPSAYFEEIVFSPNWHLPSDTIGNCNIPYLKKVTGGALATLAEQQLLPYPQNLRVKSGKQDITLWWKPTKNARVKGCNVYRADSATGEFRKISAAPVTDSVYRDTPGLLNKSYHYMVTTVNDLTEESAYSNRVIGARFNFCDTLLVLANTKGNKTTPDSILSFYHSILDTIPYKWMDVNAVQRAGFDVLSRYRNIFWMSNSLEYEMISEEMYLGLEAFSENGGNMLYTGFYPGRMWLGGSIPYPSHIPDEVLFHKVFKVDSIDRKIQSMLFRSNPAAPGYDTLNIDPGKNMDKNFPGQIYNIEVYAPAPEANVIYRFDSKYDGSTSYGKMKGRPVGLEYMGSDFKSILLSFPLYYLDTSDAREFLHYVVNRKFLRTVGVEQPAVAAIPGMKVFPNPVKESCKITFTTSKPGHVTIKLVSMVGNTVDIPVDRRLEGGMFSLVISTASLSPGIYYVCLQQESGTDVSKIIKVD
jgi:hypothetical protein